jgi:hypothetical protein
LTASGAFVAPAANKIFITSTSKTNQPTKAGQASSEAASVARQMEVFTTEALSDQYMSSCGTRQNTNVRGWTVSSRRS